VNKELITTLHDLLIMINRVQEVAVKVTDMHIAMLPHENNNNTKINSNMINLSFSQIPRSVIDFKDLTMLVNEFTQIAS
jgi:hypothetical protein